MILGTHNSATGGKLLWWQKFFAWIINPTSKCQDRTIPEQLADGVKVFNLQVAKVAGKWRFTHGLAIYKENIFDILSLLKLGASVKEPIYFQLYNDKCFWSKRNLEEFKQLIEYIKTNYCTTYFIMQDTWFEGTDIHPYTNKCNLQMEEHYWSMGWAKHNAESWIDKLPLPKRHAKKYNKKYKSNCKKEYLMLDFYEQ